MSTGDNQQDLFGADASQTPSEPAQDAQLPKRAANDKTATKPAMRLSPVANRIIEASANIQLSESDKLTFQHTVMCQTSLPYHRIAERHWVRRNGNITLEIEAGRALDPRSGMFGPVELPFGARSRLVLLHLNSRALQTGQPEIEVEDSLTAFVREILGRHPGGRDVKTIRDQLTMLAAATVRLGMTDGRHAVQVNGSVVDAFDLWAPDHASQTILWPSTVRLGHRYFESLVNHAVPLDQRAVGALSHSALALDLYSWLAQRLHRIPYGIEQLVAWPNLYEQFGAGYKRLRDFRRFFLTELLAVHIQYAHARIEADQQGLHLRYSPPPVSRKLIAGPATTL